MHTAINYHRVAYQASDLTRHASAAHMSEQAQEQYGDRLDGGFHSEQTRAAFHRIATELGYRVTPLGEDKEKTFANLFPGKALEADEFPYAASLLAALTAIADENGMDESACASIAQDAEELAQWAHDLAERARNLPNDYARDMADARADAAFDEAREYAAAV